MAYEQVAQYGDAIGTAKAEQKVVVRHARITNDRSKAVQDRLEVRLVKVTDDGREFNVSGTDRFGKSLSVVLPFDNREDVEALVATLEAALADGDFDFTKTAGEAPKEAEQAAVPRKPVVNAKGKAASRSRKAS